MRLLFGVPAVGAGVKLETIFIFGHDVVPVDGLVAEAPMAGVAQHRPHKDSGPNVGQRNWQFGARI